MGATEFRKSALREDAPSVANCLTSIYYIFKQALGIDLPMTFIGDMPRQLLSCSRWRALRINSKDMKCGDLLFVKNRENERLISHVALFIDVDKIFHCYQRLGTAATQSEEKFFSLYEQKLEFRKMARYIDARNQELREKHGGIYIVD